MKHVLWNRWQLIFLVKMQVNQCKDILMLCYVTITKNCLESCLEYQDTNVHLHFLVLIIMLYVPTIWLPVYTTHFLVPVYTTHFLAYLRCSILYSWYRFPWITIQCKIQWLVVFPSNYGTFIHGGSCKFHSQWNHQVDFLSMFLKLKLVTFIKLPMITSMKNW